MIGPLAEAIIFSLTDMLCLILSSCNLIESMMYMMLLLSLCVAVFGRVPDFVASAKLPQRSFPIIRQDICVGDLVTVVEWGGEQEEEAIRVALVFPLSILGMYCA